jgi:hypothetical protein
MSHRSSAVVSTVVAGLCWCCFLSNASAEEDSSNEAESSAAKQAAEVSKRAKDFSSLQTHKRMPDHFTTLFKRDALSRVRLGVECFVDRAKLVRKRLRRGVEVFETERVNKDGEITKKNAFRLSFEPGSQEFVLEGRF